MTMLARTKAREALIELSAAFEKLSEIWNDHEVAEILDDHVTVTDVNKGTVLTLYPFQKSFDELTEDVKEWACYMADEIDYTIARDEMILKMGNLDVRPSTIARIAEDLYKEYKDWEG